MKKLIPALLILFFIGFALAASAQTRPKYKAKKVFSHNAESGQGKTDRAQFRKESSNRPPIDLRPHKLESFKTAKANKHYKFSNGKGLKPAR